MAECWDFVSFLPPCCKTIMENDKTLRLGLLVDAENMHQNYMRKVLPHIFKLGRPIVQFAFGDFSIPAAKPWVEFLRTNVIEARQVTPSESGKNAADIALVVEAMRLALTGKCDALCVVSSDRDFVALTTFLKSEGFAVYGFGKSTTHKKYRQSCAKFFEVNLDEEGAIAVPEVQDTPLKHANAGSLPVRQLNWPRILQAIAQLADSDGWAPLQPLGLELGRQGISVKAAGKANWAKVFSTVDDLELRQDEQNLRSVRIRPTAKAA